MSKEICIKTLGTPKSNNSKNKKINLNNGILFIPSGEMKRYISLQICLQFC